MMFVRLEMLGQSQMQTEMQEDSQSTVHTVTLNDAASERRFPGPEAT
jgi:hypothetical protein